MDSRLPVVPGSLAEELLKTREGQRYLCRLYRESAGSIPADVAQRLDRQTLLGDDSLTQIVNEFVRLHPERLARPLIDACLRRRDVTRAKSLLRASKLSINEFPQLLAEAYYAAFNFFAFKEKIDPVALARLVEGDQAGSVYFVIWAAQKGWDTASACLFYLSMDKETREKVPTSMWPKEHLVRPNIWNGDRETLEECQNRQPKDLPQRIKRRLDPSEKTLNLFHMGMTLNSITIVTTAEEVEKVTNAARDAQFVGLDCEWRATFCPGEPQLVCLMQMSFRDAETSELRAYLIDLKTLSEDERVWLCLSDFLSEESKGLCLGLSFASGDISALRATRPGLFRVLRGYSELSDLCQGHLCRHPEVLLRSAEFEKAEPPTWRRSLDASCRLLLERDIDKQSQLTNWAARPLTVDQAIYAATDAAALVLMAEKILEANKDCWDATKIYAQALATVREYNENKSKQPRKSTDNERTIDADRNMKGGTIDTDKNSKRGTNDTDKIHSPPLTPKNWIQDFTETNTTPIFVCQQTKLVECLRTIGVDCRYPEEVGKEAVNDPIFVYLVTDKSMRNKLSMFRNKFEVSSSEANKRFHEVIDTFRIPLPDLEDLTVGRCMYCNHPGPWKMEILSESAVEVRRCGFCGGVEWVEGVKHLRRWMTSE